MGKAKGKYTHTPKGKALGRDKILYTIQGRNKDRNSSKLKKSK